MGLSPREGSPHDSYSEHLAQVLQGLFQVLIGLADTVLPHLVQVVGWVGAIRVRGAEAQP